MSHTTLSRQAAHLGASLPAWIQGLLPGVVLCAALAGLSMLLGQVPWLQAHGFSALTLAIVLGMLVGNTVYPRIAARHDAGVSFSKQSLLRLGVVLYGLRLTMQDIGHVGLAGVATDALVLGSTFTLACFIGRRWLGMDRQTAMLIGAGSSICGAAAVMATAPVLRAKADQVAVAVATVVVYGTAAIFLYPVLFELNKQWPFILGGANGFGIYAGSTVHEVAQVLAAARAASPQAADTAVITKMVRVMMLAPFLISLSAWLARDHRLSMAPSAQPQPKLAVPWFAFAFIGMVLFNSLRLLSPHELAISSDADTVLLAMAMAALGLATQWTAIRLAGIKPLLLGGILFAWLVAGGALINHGVQLAQHLL